MRAGIQNYPYIIVCSSITKHHDKNQRMAAGIKPADIPQENIDYYNKLVATNPKIERKGLNVPYTSCNGHMFSYLEKDGLLGLRLPEELLEEFLKKYKTTLFKSYGIIKKEYALVP